MNIDQNIVERLKNLEAMWKLSSAVPENMFDFSPGLTKTDIFNYLNRLRTLVETSVEANYKINPISYSVILSVLQNIDTYIQQHIPSNPIPHFPGLLSQLHSLSTIINQAITKSMPVEITEEVNQLLQENLVEAKANAETFSELTTDVKILIESNKNAILSIEENLLKTQDATAKIEERLRITLETTNHINETEQKSVALYNELESTLKKVKEQSDFIKIQQNQIETLAGSLQKHLQDAQNLLEDANRIGLAGAFKTRKDQLNWPAKGWNALFFSCVVALCWLAFDSLGKIDSSDWHRLLFRIPFSAPLIWLGWFAVKQYGYTRRIQEDYSFKVASAMSFQGYRNEINTDNELLTLLRKSAIDNFSSNPLRIYENQTDPATPIHELIDKLSPEKIGKVAEIVKAISSNKN